MVGTIAGGSAHAEGRGRECEWVGVSSSASDVRCTRAPKMVGTFAVRAERGRASVCDGGGISLRARAVAQCSHQECQQPWLFRRFLL
jgi:hypothetical protein